MGRFIRKDADGTIWMQASDGVWHPITARETVTANRVQKTNNSSDQQYKFKLLTIREISTLDLGTVQQRLADSYANAARAALLQGNPIPAPVPLPADTSPEGFYYSCFVDEDLYGTSTPVYTFYSPIKQVKGYITNNGDGKGDWSIHLCYFYDETILQSGIKRRKWRLISIDNGGLGNSSQLTYLFDSSQVPACFEYNFSLPNIVYSGGGVWNILAIDQDDTIPTFGYAPKNDSRYQKVDQPSVIGGNNHTIIGNAATPTYSLTWCRGYLTLNKRERSASIEFDSEYMKSDAVFRHKRVSDYTLDLDLRPAMGAVNRYTHKEICNSISTFVANTQPYLGSARQSPDYGTDYKRYSLEEYYQESNVVRPIDASDISATGVLAASNNAQFLLRLNLGTGEGSIKQPYAIKHAIGERGVTYGWGYKSWWAYGKVISTYPQYKLQRTTKNSAGFQFPSRYFVDIVDGANPYGELLQKENPANEVYTTWDAEINPPSGFFGTVTGTFKFVLKYIMPPLFATDAVYYFHLNPPKIGTEGNTTNREFDTSNAAPAAFSLASTFPPLDNSGNNNQNTFINVYGQILGTNSIYDTYNIGAIEIARDDVENRVVFSPTPDQTAELKAEPSLFPNGYADNPYSTEKYDNLNNPTFIQYQANGDLA